MPPRAFSEPPSLANNPDNFDKLDDWFNPFDVFGIDPTANFQSSQHIAAEYHRLVSLLATYRAEAHRLPFTLKDLVRAKAVLISNIRLSMPAGWC